MILIADSGASKTDWRLLHDNGTIEQFKSLGLNPNYRTPDGIKSELKNSMKPLEDINIGYLYFYGSGCATKTNQDLLTGIFNEFFPQAQIEINHDSLAAARALCAHEPGIACILGTGANSCLFNGESITYQVPNLGFILGDEGSGAWLGKKLLQQFIKDRLPEEIRDKLFRQYALTRDIIIENVYQKPMPSEYMASFSKFIFQNIDHPYIYQLIYNGFRLFFTENVMKYKNHQTLPVHFVGSVAYYYSNILRQAGQDLGIAVKNIIESPIAGLTLYHQKSRK